MIRYFLFLRVSDTLEVVEDKVIDASMMVAAKLSQQQEGLQIFYLGDHFYIHFRHTRFHKY